MLLDSRHVIFWVLLNVSYAALSLIPCLIKRGRGGEWWCQIPVAAPLDFFSFFVSLPAFHYLLLSLCVGPPLSLVLLRLFALLFLVFLSSSTNTWVKKGREKKKKRKKRKKSKHLQHVYVLFVIAIDRGTRKKRATFVTSDKAEWPGSERRAKVNGVKRLFQVIFVWSIIRRRLFGLFCASPGTHGQRVKE
jgi:hypothetical protein